MNPGFDIRFYHSAGNLHIHLFGEFNGMCAWELFKIIRKKSLGQGRVFISTNGLDVILPTGVALFKQYMTAKKYPNDWLYFKGEKGFQIAPDGSRVLINNKKNNRVRPNSKNSARHRTMIKEKKMVLYVE